MPYTILLLALAVTGYFITLAIYRIYFHALSEYPGPKLWIATRLMFVQSMLRGNNIRDVAAIHKKYGDVVRIAPNELSYAKTQAWDDIFGYRPGHREFPRNPVWWTSPPGQPSSFTTANDVDHPRMRKVLSHAFSDKALRDMEPTLQKYTRLLISRLRETISRDGEDKNVVNIVDWYRFTMFDIIRDLLFNEPFDCLSNCQFHWWIQGVSNAFKINAFLGCIRFFPGLESLLYKFMPQSLLDIQRRHYQAVIDKTQKRIAEGTERPDIMSYLIRNNDSQGMTMSEIESSMNVLSIGGSHNTASTLSGITNYLTKNSTCLQRLNAEIRSTYKTDEDITLANLSGLPYLNAVINEGLRMAPPFPAGLPRCVPEGGDTICGEFIPGGVNSWALQRVSSAFALPDDFIPERWLDAKDLDPESAEIFANDEHEAVQQFSVGPRACLGKQFAYAEMRLVLASIVLNFDIEKVNSPRGRVQWENQKTYMVVEEEPFDVRLIPYNAV